MRTRALALASLGLALVASCGLKADPKAPELVRPEVITDLSGEVVKEGVRLAWTRPDAYSGGQRMDDLGGFLVFRGLPGELAQEIADIPVEDRDRFRRAKKFEYVDKQVEQGATYYYRVVSRTTDEYYSAASNQATLAVVEGGKSELAPDAVNAPPKPTVAIPDEDATPPPAFKMAPGTPTPESTPAPDATPATETTPEETPASETP